MLITQNHCHLGSWKIKTWTPSTLHSMIEIPLFLHFMSKWNKSSTIGKENWWISKHDLSLELWNSTNRQLDIINYFSNLTFSTAKDGMRPHDNDGSYFLNLWRKIVVFIIFGTKISVNIYIVISNRWGVHYCSI